MENGDSTTTSSLMICILHLIFRGELINEDGKGCTSNALGENVKKRTQIFKPENYGSGYHLYAYAYVEI